MNDNTAPIQNLGQRCRICDSIFTVQIQDIVGQRSGDWLRQIFCMDCRSFFHDSNYSEDDGQQLADFEALIRDLDNHLAVQSQLALELKTRVPSASSVLEIGHGTGCFFACV